MSPAEIPVAGPQGPPGAVGPPGPAISAKGRRYMMIEAANEGYSLATAVSMSGVIDVRCLCVLDTLSPASFQTLVAQEGAAGTRAWKLDVTTTGLLRLQPSVDGTTFVTYQSSVTLASVLTNPLAPVWLRAVYVPDDGTGSPHHSNVTFYYSYNGATWTQIGTVQQSTTLGPAYHATTPAVYAGERQDRSNRMSGRIYEISIYDGTPTERMRLDVRAAADPPATIPDGVTPANVWTPAASAQLFSDEVNWQDFRKGTLFIDALMGGSPGQIPVTKQDGTVSWLGIGEEWSVTRDGGADLNIGDLDPFQSAMQARLDAGYAVKIPGRGAAGWAFTPGAAASPFLDLTAEGAALLGTPKSTILVPKPGADGAYHGDVFHASHDEVACEGMRLKFSLPTATLNGAQTIHVADTNFSVVTGGNLDTKGWPASGYAALSSNRSGPTPANRCEAAVISYTGRTSTTLTGCNWLLPPIADRTYITGLTIAACAGDGAFLRLVNDLQNAWFDKIRCDGYWLDVFAVGSDRGDLDWVVSTTAGSNTITRVSGPAFTAALENLSAGGLDAIGLVVFGGQEADAVSIHYVDASHLTIWSNTAHTVPSTVLSTQSQCRMHMASGTAKSHGGPGGASFFNAGTITGSNYVRHCVVGHDNLDKADQGNSGMLNVRGDSFFGQDTIRWGGAGRIRVAVGKAFACNKGLVGSNRVPNNVPALSGPNTAAIYVAEYEIESVSLRPIEMGVDSLMMLRDLNIGRLHVNAIGLMDAVVHVDNHIQGVLIDDLDANIIQASPNVAAVFQFNTNQRLQIAIGQVDIRSGSGLWQTFVRYINGLVPSGVNLGPNIIGAENIAAWLSAFDAAGNPLADIPGGAAYRMGRLWRFLPAYHPTILPAAGNGVAWKLGIPKLGAARARLVFTGTAGGAAVCTELKGVLTRGPNSTDPPVWTPDGAAIAVGAGSPTLDWVLTNATGVGYAQARITAGASQIDGRFELLVDANQFLSISVPATTVMVVAS